MISCAEFRAQFQSGTDDAAMLQHLRACDPCLDHAAHLDPDVMFRAIGGGEIVPPGGVDAFVADVMNAVHLKSAEGAIVRRPVMSWTRKLAIAAALGVGVTGATIVYQFEHGPAAKPGQSVAAVRTPIRSEISLTTKPIVQSYSSSNATIVEVPAENANDSTQIVMIVDENLPADL
jgi:hypothetical protein